MACIALVINTSSSKYGHTPPSVITLSWHFSKVTELLRKLWELGREVTIAKSKKLRKKKEKQKCQQKKYRQRKGTEMGRNRER